jgi:magnesium transporter
MIEQICQINENFTWLDVTNPSSSEVEKLIGDHKIPSKLIEDCLDPEHLPKYEKNDNIHFLIIRVPESFDPKNKKADNIQKISRKVVIFLSDNFLITIHRRPLEFLGPISQKWSKQTSGADFPKAHLLYDILNCAFVNFEQPIQQIIDRLAFLESKLFSSQVLLEDIYVLKRRAYVYKRLCRMSLDVVQKLLPVFEKQTYHQDLKETLDDLFFYAEDIFENTSGLVNIHLSIESQKTNDVIRMLTVISMFFMPLTFIVGLYGMNFKAMPEIEWEHGYLFSWVVMILTTALTYVWFKRKKLL